MTTVKLILERSRVLNDGSYPVVFQIIHSRARRLIYTPYRIYEQKFDVVNERVLFISNEVRCKNDVCSMNRKIKEERICINGHIEELVRIGSTYVVADVISRYRIFNDSFSLLGYYDLQIVRKREIGKLGTVRAYTYTRTSVANFINFRHVRISDVDFSFISDYERFLINSKISANTICFHMRNFKSVYNQALIDGYPLPDKCPFKYVQVKLQKTVKRALDKSNILLIRELNLADRDILKLSRDLFLFSFYSRGMAMVDMVYLTHRNIHNKVIVYNRLKTNQRLEVAITDDMLDIINMYKSDSDYIFPILNSDDPKELYRQYRLSLERTNRHLKEIGNMLNFESPLTTYVARHSWATHAKKIGVSMSIISEGLGHTSEKTTQIYLKAFDRSTLDKANEKITRFFR